MLFGQKAFLQFLSKMASFYLRISIRMIAEFSSIFELVDVVWSRDYREHCSPE